MNIPGVTTTRLLLALAILCATTGSLEGLGTALLIVTVGGLRLLARRQDGMQTAPAGTRMTSMAPVVAPLAHRRQAA